MWNKIVSLYIDDTSIRLLVTKGQRLKKWADLALDPGLVKGGVVLKEVEVGAMIKDLLKREKIRARKIKLGFSGLHSLTRPLTLPVLPHVMLQEAVAREARRVLPVPLDQLYLSWRLLPSPKGKQQVFVAATPRKTADSLIKTLKIAGLEPAYMAIKPLILTRALREDTAIILDVQPTEFDIVIISDGVPQPIRTVTLPDTAQSWQQKMDMIAGDLDRTIKFFNSNNPEKGLVPAIPLYVSGELMDKPESHQALAATTGHPVKLLPPILKGQRHEDHGRYLANIAISIPAPSRLRESTSAIANMNVLPAPYQPKPISLTKVIGVPGGVALAGLVVPMVMLLQNTSANIASVQNQLENTNKMVNQKVSQQKSLKKDITGLEKKAAAVKTAYDNLQSSLNSLIVQQEGVNGDLDTALRTAPASLILTGVSESGATLTINGKAPAEEDVLGYARALDSSGRFSETTVTSISNETSASEQHTVFTLTMTRK